MSVDIGSLSILRSVDVPEGRGAVEVKAPKGIGRGFRCLYREFTVPGDDVARNVQSLVDFRKALPSADRRVLDSTFLWPLALVESAGRAVGYLTSVLPSRFEEQVQTPHSGRVTVARTLDWLTKPTHARDVGASVIVEADDIILRAAYCAQIARAIHFLHSRSVVFGDLGALAAASSNSPVDVVMIGSEFMHRAESTWDVAAAHSPGTTPPECVRGQRDHTIGTDRFKLALLFRDILGAGGDTMSALSCLTGRVDHDGIALFERGLGVDADARPSAADWYAYLYAQTISHSAPPLIEMFGAVPEHGLRGQSVELVWHVQGHRSLTLETPWGEVRELDISVARHRLTLRQSGQFRLTASNRHGTTERSSDMVYAFEPPAVSFVEVPELAGVGHAMTGLDVTELSEHVVHGHEFNWLYGTVDAVATPELPPLPELPQFESPAVALQQIDWQGLTSVVDTAMRAADAEVRRTHRVDTGFLAQAAARLSRVRSLVETVASGRPRARTRR